VQLSSRITLERSGKFENNTEKEDQMRSFFRPLAKLRFFAGYHLSLWCNYVILMAAQKYCGLEVGFNPPAWGVERQSVGGLDVARSENK